jgi:hypothetical protein
MKIFAILALALFPALALADPGEIRFGLELPTERIDGTALTVEDLEAVTLHCGAEQSEPFGLSSYSFEPSESHTARRVEALPGHGEWWCSATVTDQQGRESDYSQPVAVSWEVAAPRPPVIELVLTD